MVIVDAEEIIEVATDILGSLHRSIDFQLVAVFGKGRERTGQEILLYLAGQRQVFLQRLQLSVFLLRCMHIVDLPDCLLDGQSQVVHIDGLRSKVESAVVHSQSDVPHVAIGTYHDNAHCGITSLIEFCQQRQTVHLGHVDVTQDNFNVGMFIQDGKRLHAVAGKEELIIAATDLPPEKLFQQQFDRSLVVNT